MAEAGTHAVRSLFVTLRRGYAGAPWFHRRVLEALGLQHRHQCVEKPNNPSIRGMLAKVPHLVTIETDRMFYLRSLKEHHEQLCRPPWVLHHDPVLLEQAGSSAAGAGADPGWAQRDGAEASTSGGGAEGPAPVAAQPRVTPFAQQQLMEHVLPAGMAGFAASGLRPLPPRRYFVEQKRQRRAKMLVEQGIFSAAGVADHQRALAPKSFRRRTGLRD